MKKINSDTIVAICFITLAGFWYYLIKALPNQQPKGPGFYPTILVCCMLFLAIILLIKSLIVGTNVKIELTKKDGIRVLIAVVSLIAYLILLPKLGYVVATGLLLTVLITLFGEKKKLQAAVVSMITSGVIYFVFHTLFSVQLP